ncbi:MAG TPA: FAD-linked oxidase C-terminal domain-containing protein [Acidimicrobiales bacterium]|nr:FAD-linked oxidase C-terminal domain-containing protein [Acidimicrobiales bacterium]
MSAPDLLESLRAIVGPANVATGDHVSGDDTHDESLTGVPVRPLAVARPSTTEQVRELLAFADDARLPVIARGSGTGLAGGALPVEEGIVVCFDRMSRIVEIDEQNHVAVVQPGVTLRQLDDALATTGYVYPVYPGEMSASIGGNVATNAGGMRAVRYGVTRHNVLGLELVLPGGQVLRTGGKFVKSSTGYDLTQLVLGSEGTLALVTEVTLKLVPRLAHHATLLAPFTTLVLVASAVPKLLGGGVSPLILEYLDTGAMAAIVQEAGLELGVPDEIREKTAAYLVVVLESAHAERLDEDTEAAAELLGDLGALDVYVLPPSAGANLITARERVFFVAKALGADDIVDTVVPRAAIPDFLAATARLAAEHAAIVSGCGHVGDGNVHLSVFQPDVERRHVLLEALFRAAHDLGGAVSGEHGIGTEKQSYWLELEDPAKIALMRRIKSAFDPNGILGPRRLADPPAPAGAPAQPGAGSSDPEVARERGGP